MSNSSNLSVNLSVDVVIAAKNEARFIEQCLQAVKNQDYPEHLVKIYVVDNGSSDKTVSIAKSIGVNVLEKLDCGVSEARNLGISQGSGNLIAFLDAHCVPASNWLSLIVCAFSENDCGGCQGGIDFLSCDEKNSTRFSDIHVRSLKNTIENTTCGQKTIYPWIMTGNAIYRRKILEAIGSFDCKLIACEDIDLSWRVILKGYRLLSLPKAQVIHYEVGNWKGFLKNYLYGKGAAQLEYKYRLHRTSNALPNLFNISINKSSINAHLVNIFYSAGFYFMQAAIRIHNILEQVPTNCRIQNELRKPFQWDAKQTIKISEEILFWFPNKETTILVSPSKTRRVVTTEVGNFIWRGLTKGKPKKEIIEELAAFYEIDQNILDTDVNDLVEEFIKEEFIEKC